MHESNTWSKLLCAAVKIVILKPDYSPPPPPSKGQWQYTKDLPFSNVNISWNKDDFLYKLCISQGRRLDSASRVQSSREVRMETRCSLGYWSLISGNVFFPWLLVSLTSLTISRQLVLIPKGLSSVLFSNKQTFNLTMTLSTSIFRAVKATQPSTFRDFSLACKQALVFPYARYVAMTYIQNTETSCSLFNNSAHVSSVVLVKHSCSSQQPITEDAIWTRWAQVIILKVPHGEIQP